MAINNEKKWKDGKEVFALLLYLLKKGGKCSYAEIAKFKGVKQYSSSAARADEKKILTLGYKVSLTSIYEPEFRTTYRAARNSRCAENSRGYSNAVQASTEEIYLTLRELNRSCKRYNGSVYGSIPPELSSLVVKPMTEDKKKPVVSFIDKTGAPQNIKDYVNKVAPVEAENEEAQIEKTVKETVIIELTPEPKETVPVVTAWKMIQTKLPMSEIKAAFPRVEIMGLGEDNDGDIYITPITSEKEFIESLAKISSIDELKVSNVSPDLESIKKAKELKHKRNSEAEEAELNRAKLKFEEQMKELERLREEEYKMIKEKYSSC